MSFKDQVVRLAGMAAIAGVSVIVAPPGVAVAEGPGYGGTADQLSVRWSTTQAVGAALTVSGVGFRAGSSVALRVGDTVEELVIADATGAVTAGTAVTEAVGSSIIAVGQTPSGSTLTLVGFVPSPATGDGTRSLSTWVLPALGIVAIAGVLLGRSRRRSRRPRRVAADAERRN